MEHGSSSSTQEVKRSRVGQPERANCWMFTINNPGIPGGELCQSLRSSIESAVRDSAGKGLSYFVFQLERGAEGTEHFQGYLEHSSRVSRPALLGILGAAHDSCKGAYLEPRRSRSADACISYCTKVDTRIDGPWSGGSPSVSPGQGARTDSNPWSVPSTLPQVVPPCSRFTETSEKSWHGMGPPLSDMPLSSHLLEEQPTLLPSELSFYSTCRLWKDSHRPR